MALAGLPRLVRSAPELRWRGGAALGTGLASAAFWLATWLIGERVDVLWSAIGAAAVGVPAALATALTAPRRVERALGEVRLPPRDSVYETPAAARERRTRLAGIVLTGIVVLLAFDRVTDGGGVMAGLIAGLFVALGASDLRDARSFGMAEVERSTRIFFLVPSIAFSARFGVSKLYEEAETSRSGLPDVTPFDLGM